MSRVFTPRKMNALEGQVRDFCAKCLDPLVGGEKFDFARDLGVEMPMKVIGMLLGIPESDQTAVRDKSDAFLRTKPGKPMDVKQEAIANGDMFAEYVDWRAKHPSDDLMTALLERRVRGRHGNEAEAQPGGGAHLYAGARGSRKRDDGPVDRLAGEDPGRAPGPAPRAGLGSHVDSAGDRGDAALRADRSAPRALCGPRRRVLRSEGAGRERDAAAGRCGQPGRAALPGSRSLRHPPRARGSTSRSVSASTSAWAPRSLGSRPEWRSKRCSSASPTGRSTTPTPGWRPPRRCGVGSRCPSSFAEAGHA